MIVRKEPPPLRHRVVRRAAVALLASAAIAGVIYYFAWVTSIVQPVDWDHVLAYALFFAPIGLLAGLYPE